MHGAFLRDPALRCTRLAIKTLWSMGKSPTSSLGESSAQKYTLYESPQAVSGRIVASAQSGHSHLSAPSWRSLWVCQSCCRMKVSIGCARRLCRRITNGTFSIPAVGRKRSWRRHWRRWMFPTFCPWFDRRGTTASERLPLRCRYSRATFSCSASLSRSIRPIAPGAFAHHSCARPGATRRGIAESLPGIIEERGVRPLPNAQEGHAGGSSLRTIPWVAWSS